MTTDSTEPRSPAIAGALQRLRRSNLLLSLLHGVQAVAVLLLANGATLPVTGSYLDGPPGGGAIAPPTLLYQSRVAWGVAGFFAISAVAHALIAGPLFSRYAQGLARSRNIYRWVEYSLSASLMIVLIAGITGITDVAALLALFGVNASMILFGWLMETTSDPGPASTGRRSCSAASPGSSRGSAIGVYLVGAGERACPPSSTGSSCRCSCSSTASPSTSGCSTAARPMGRLPLRRADLHVCSAWSPRPRSPGRSSPARSPAEPCLTRHRLRAAPRRCRRAPCP